jgi:hypothetical protein
VTQLWTEPFIHLADLAHDRVLIAWGAFFFTRDGDDARWEIVDDQQLPDLAGRRTCIGTSAEPFGTAKVRVLREDGYLAAETSTNEGTWIWVTGLEPDTEYRYEVLIDGEPWADGERWDWLPTPRGGYDLVPSGRRYDLRFRTWPDPDRETPPVRFVALGDYGVGIRSDSESSRRQRRVAEVLDRLVADEDIRFVLSLGDNIYQGEEGRVDDESGGEDDDWYSSFFAPYRYALARVPFFPAIGNHDTTDTEGSDDRAQLEDNFHLKSRFADEKDRASVEPGLFYRLRYGRDVEFVCIDTSHDDADEGVHRFFQAPEHQDWLGETFAPRELRWQIPFSHHPVFCAGPSHTNDAEMLQTLVPLFDRAGVRLVLAGHEHNFQLSEVDGRTYVVSGAGGKLREDRPAEFDAAGTVAWNAQAHLLLVELDGTEARLTPVSGMLPDGRPQLMTALGPDNEVHEPPFVVRAE